MKFMTLDRNAAGPLSKREIKHFKLNLSGSLRRGDSAKLHPLSLANDLSNRMGNIPRSDGRPAAPGDGFNDAVAMTLGIALDSAERPKVREGAGLVLREFMMTDAMPKIAAAVTPMALDPTNPTEAFFGVRLLSSALKRYPHRREELLSAVASVEGGHRVRDYLIAKHP